MACKNCGRQVPVLQRASKPEGQRFVGMCKPCIEKDLRAMRQDQMDRLKEFLRGIFS